MSKCKTPSQSRGKKPKRSAERVRFSAEESRLLQAAKKAGITLAGIGSIAGSPYTAAGAGRKKLEQFIELVNSPDFRPDPMDQRYMRFVEHRSGLRPGTMADRLLAALEHLRGTYGPRANPENAERVNEIPDAITMAVAKARYQVSDKTIRRQINAGRIRSRKTGDASNSPLMVSENDIAKLYPKR